MTITAASKELQPEPRAETPHGRKKLKRNRRNIYRVMHFRLSDSFPTKDIAQNKNKKILIIQPLKRLTNLAASKASIYKSVTSIAQKGTQNVPSLLSSPRPQIHLLADLIGLFLGHDDSADWSYRSYVKAHKLI